MRNREAGILLLASLFVQTCQFNQENVSATADPVFPTETLSSERETLARTPKLTETDLVTEISVTPVCDTADFETELPDPDVPENYIGRYFGAGPTFPEELTFLTATCIGSNCSHGVVEVKKENTFLFWIDENICHDEHGRVKDIIVDAIETPPLKKTEMHSPNSFCWDQNGRLYNVFAIGRFNHEAPSIHIDELWNHAKGWYLEEIYFAVRIDTATMRFVGITDSDIACAYLDNAHYE